MGKKKAARNKRGGQKVGRSGSSSLPKDTTESSCVDHPNKLIAKLRSPDRSVRHSTLAALLHTSFHASVLSSGFPRKHQHGVLSRPLLQAIRDQVVSFDPLPYDATPKQISSYKEQLRCSILATECLGNYVCYVNDDEDSNEGAWVAGWILIFMQRIQDFIDFYTRGSNNGILSTGLQHTISDMYLELVDKCIIGLVYLFERNPLAMDRLRVVQQPCRSNDLDIHSILSFLLQHTHSILTSTCVVSTRHHVYHSIQLYAARCLHSIWDDNFDFISSFRTTSLLQKPSHLNSMTILEILETIIQTTWNALTGPRSLSLTNDSSLAAIIVTGLHSCGAYMAAWFALQTKPDEIPPLFNGCIPLCIQLVGRIVMNGSPEQSFLWFRMQVLEGQLLSAHLEYCNEQMDTELEENVLKQQHKKMESARSIARRLKQMKTSALSDAMNPSEAGCKVTEGSDSKAARVACPLEQKIDRTAHWEEVQMEWFDTVRPIELAVELVANWASPCSSCVLGDVDVGMEEDDVMIEAPFYDMKPSFAPELVANLKHFQISLALRELFTYLTDWYKNTIQGTSIRETPIIVIDSLGDLIYKTIAAMECCHTCEAFPESGHPSGDSTLSMWNLLRSFLFDVVTVTEVTKLDLYVRIQSATTGAMVSLLRRMSLRPPFISTKKEDLAWVQKLFSDLMLMLEFMVKVSPDNPVFARDTVCMVGLLVCRFPKSFSSADIFTLTQVLMSLTRASEVDTISQMMKERISVMILSEILNVFMDIFSEDDFHPDVFDQGSILLYFEQMIPVLKQEMQWNRLQHPTDENVSIQEMLQHCQDTVANASRFVEYKIDLGQN